MVSPSVRYWHISCCNIYKYKDSPTIVAKKMLHADDLAIMHSTKDWKALKEVLSQDIATLPTYFHKWQLKLGTAKTVFEFF